MDVGVVWSAMFLILRKLHTGVISCVMKQVDTYHIPKSESHPSVLRYALSLPSKEGMHVIV